MLIYDPTLDPYHCALRILAIVKEAPASGFELEKVRIADFFLSFPSELMVCRLPKDMTFIRRKVKDLVSPYRRPIGARNTFDRTMHIFNTAASALAATSLINAKELKAGVIHLGDTPIPSPLQRSIGTFMARQSDVREFITRKLTTIPLRGEGGLKDRSGLLEFKYDAA